MKLSKGTAKDCVAKFVLQYAITPHTTIGCCTSELLFVRKLHTHLDTVKPDIEKFFEETQSRQKENHYELRTCQLETRCSSGIPISGKPRLLGVILK